MPSHQVDVETAKYLARELRKARHAARAFESLTRQWRELWRRVDGGHFYYTMPIRARELDQLTMRSQARHGFLVTKGLPPRPTSTESEGT
jgi:hypothetical protein